MPFFEAGVSQGSEEEKKTPGDFKIGHAHFKGISDRGAAPF